MTTKEQLSELSVLIDETTTTHAIAEVHGDELNGLKETITDFMETNKIPVSVTTVSKITADSVDALLNGYEFKRSNTAIITSKDENGEQVSRMKAYGFIIAERFPTSVVIQLPTAYNKTMVDRLNGIPGVEIQINKKLLTLNGSPWIGNKVVIPMS